MNKVSDERLRELTVLRPGLSLNRESAEEIRSLAAELFVLRQSKTDSDRLYAELNFAYSKISELINQIDVLERFIEPAKRDDDV